MTTCQHCGGRVHVKHACGTPKPRLSQSFDVAEVDWLSELLSRLGRGDDVRNTVLTSKVAIATMRKVQRMRWKFDKLQRTET